jgi:uncharacterized protein YidB (DUF937 family)
MGILSGLLAQSGGLQGLANRFAQGGHGDIFSSWVSTGENKPITGDQMQNVLGSGQVQALAKEIGIDPAQASHFLAEFLPKVVDGLTPNGKLDASADHEQSLASMLPSLLQSFGGGKSLGT